MAATMTGVTVSSRQAPARRVRVRSFCGVLASVLGCVLAVSCVSTSSRPAQAVLHPQSPEEFRQILRQNSRPVLAAFTTASCASCRSLAGSLEELAADYKGRLTIVQADLALTGGLIQEYDLIKVPTSILFRQGQEVDRWHGALPPLLMRPFIDKALRGGRQ